MDIKRLNIAEIQRRGRQREVSGSRRSMTRFQCADCGFGSLVRSNFRASVSGELRCRSSLRCKERRAELLDASNSRSQLNDDAE